MRLIVLGGFLGSGKTSILIPLAKELVNASGGPGKTRVAIVENEIGAVGIDSAMTDSRDFTSRELFNGCVCCSMVDSLLDCLCQIEQQEDPEWVILEATGLARPHDIAENVREFYDENMPITSIIIIDAGRWMKLSAALGELVHDQIEGADYILLNKTDLASEELLKDTTDDIEGRTNAKLVKVSANKDPDGLAAVCKDIVAEIR